MDNFKVSVIVPVYNASEYIGNTLNSIINQDFDGYIAAALKASGDDRTEALKKAEAILCEDAAVCPIIFNESFAFVSSELRDVEIDGLGNFVVTEADLKNYKDYLD